MDEKPINTKVFLSFLISSYQSSNDQMLVVLLVVFERKEKGLERLSSSKSFIFKCLSFVAGAGIEPATS